VDPLTREYPWYTPYQFAGNMPIWAIDVDGLEPHTITGDSPDDKIKSSVEQSGVALVTASRTSVTRDNTSTAGLNAGAYTNVQNIRSQNPDNFWKFNTGNATSFSSTNEVYQGARNNESFANRLLGNEFGKDHAIGFMEHDVAAAMGDFNDKFELVLLATPGPLGLIQGGTARSTIKGSSLASGVRTSAGNVRYWRVQGGNNGLVNINAHGNVSFNSGTLYFSRGGGLHANYYAAKLKKAGHNPSILTWEVPKWFDDLVVEFQTGQRGYNGKSVFGNQYRLSPQLVDGMRARKLGINTVSPPMAFPNTQNFWIQALNENAIQGSGKIIKP